MSGRRSRSSSPSKPPLPPNRSMPWISDEIQPSRASKATRSRSELNADTRASRADRSKSYASQSSKSKQTLLDHNLVAIHTVDPGEYPPAHSPPRRAMRRNQQRSTLKTSTDPFACGFLALVSVASVVLLLLALNDDDWNFEDMNINPWFGPSSQALMAFGAQSLGAIENSEWWRLLSSPFTNAGIIHLVSNLVGLWGYGTYAARVMPLPWASVPGIYLLGSVVGSMASANLNGLYVACGATAGVCALVGVSWADSIVNPKPLIHQKLSNSVTLLLATGCYIAISLLPLVDVWFAAAGLVTGFLGSMIIMLLPKVGKDQPKNSLWLSLQVTSVILLFGLATCGIIGLALDTKVGESSSFLVDGSCLDLQWWYCLPQTNSTSGCTYTMANNNAAEGENGDMLTCPNGSRYQLTGIDPTHPEDPAVVSALCMEYCDVPLGTEGGSVTVMPPAMAPSSDDDGTGDGGTGIQPGSTTPTTPTTADPYTSIRAAGRKLQQGRRLLMELDDLDSSVW